MKVLYTNIRQNRILPAAVLVLILGVAGCGGDAQQTAAPMAPPVTVSTPTVQTIQQYAIFTGSSRACQSADVTARVSGTLETVDFEPSMPVKEGDLLFTIEETRYRAARDAAQAALASAQANLARAEVELKRVEKASQSRAVSEMDVDRSRADRDMARANVSSAQAALDEAELNYSYTRVTAPFSGVVNRNLVDAGNLVGQGGTTLLTRINRVQPIYVYFHVPESVVLAYLSSGKRAEKYETGQSDPIEAHVELANETGFPHGGVVDYIDNEVDARTGTIELRVRLENEDLALFPGLFVRVKVTGEEIPDAVLVPETAVGSDLGGKYVLIVDETSTVQQVYVELGAPQEGGTIHIAQGLKGDETIVVNGLMFARPGSKVTPLTAEQFEAMKKQKAAQG
jgi:multidrug efflux system membrane fusion protein